MKNNMGSSPVDLENRIGNLPPSYSVACNGRIDVWIFSVRQYRDQLPMLLSLLDGTEKARLESIGHALRKEAYTAAHGLLRLLLSRFHGTVGPSQWLLTTNGSGKPFPVTPDGIPATPCSLSHSGDIVAVALAVPGTDPQAPAIGVDVEQIKPLSPEQIPLDVLTPAEKALLSGRARQEQSRVFYRIWTIKEAFVKALGTGVGTDLQNLEVSFQPAGISRIYPAPRIDEPAPFHPVQMREDDRGLVVAVTGIRAADISRRLDTTENLL